MICSKHKQNYALLTRLYRFDHFNHNREDDKLINRIPFTWFLFHRNEEKKKEEEIPKNNNANEEIKILLS